MEMYEHDIVVSYLIIPTDNHNSLGFFSLSAQLEILGERLSLTSIGMDKIVGFYFQK